MNPGKALEVPELPGEKKDNKLSDVIKPKDNLQPLHNNLRLKKSPGPTYVEILHSIMKQVADVYPDVEKQILKSVT